MSRLSMVEAKLPPGFRFHPRDDELICDYLSMKLLGDFTNFSLLIDVDLNKCEPWDLPETACVGGGKEWYFFSLRDRKYATGQRTNRATISGYWKATGKDRLVARKGVVVGARKTLVFYQGRAPKGSKTEWVMHEYRGNDKPASTSVPKFPTKEDWVLCKVVYKSKGSSNKATNMASNEDNELDDTNDDDNASHSLPPLLDNNYAFEQAPQHMKGIEQVPCFSNLPLPHCPTLSLIDNTGSFPFPHLGISGLDQLSCDNEVLRTILDHLNTKIEPNRKIALLPNLAEQGYLPASGLPSHWNSFRGFR